MEVVHSGLWAPAWLIAPYSSSLRSDKVRWHKPTPPPCFPPCFLWPVHHDATLTHFLFLMVRARVLQEKISWLRVSSR